jgi:tetratricopeptide (TPR) repeat protein
MGIVFVAMGIAAEFLRRHVPLPWEWSKEGCLLDDEYRQMKWVLLLLVLATCVNPLGIKGALYPFHILQAISGDSKIFFSNITELARPITMANLTDWNNFWPFRLLIFISFISFILNRRRIDVSALLFWIFFLGFGLLALRNMVYFAFAAYLVTMLNCSNLSITQLSPFKATDERFVQITGLLVKLLFLFWVLDMGMDMGRRGYYDFEKYERKSSYLGVDLRAFPTKASNFLRSSGIKGRFYNDFNSGAYLIGRNYPNVLVYMDGRTELRGPKFFSTYLKIWDSGDTDVLDKEIKRFGLTGMFLNTSTAPIPEDLLKALIKRKDLKIIYFDYDAVIFLRDIPENAAYIRRYAIDLSKWKSIKLDLKRLGPAIVTPYQNLARAYSLVSMGFLDQALDEANAALEVDPSYFAAYKMKGRVYAERKDWQNMFLNYRQAITFEPNDLRLMTRLVTAYRNLGEFDYAIKEADKMIERGPGDASGYFAKAKVIVKKGKYKEAYDIVLQALALNKKAVSDVIEVGDVAFEDKVFDQAVRLYSLAVDTDDKNAEAHKKRGDALKELGQASRALREWEISLKLKADDGLKKKIEEFKVLQGEK